MELIYKVHNNLYVNLTNKCPCACTFCLRQNTDHVGESKSLWLEKEPTADEIIAEFANYDLSKYDDIVFCGFGEPTEALDVMLTVAKYLKNNFKNKLRLNTNGLGDLVNNRKIASEFANLIDCVSISLNTPNAKEYHDLVKSKFGDKSFDAMLSFAKDCTKYIPEVIMTTVDTTISKSDEAQCQKICDDLGITLRVRPFESFGTKIGS